MSEQHSIELSSKTVEPIGYRLPTAEETIKQTLNKMESDMNTDKVQINEKGVEATVAALELLIKNGKIYKEVMKDGKFEIVEYIDAIKVLFSLVKFIEILPEVKAEFADAITEEEIQSIIDVIDKSDLVSDNVEDMVKDGSKIALSIKTFIEKYIIGK